VSFQIGDAPRAVGACRDISLGGMFVETGAAPPYGTKLRLFFTLPELKQEITVESIVRWTKPDGMGVQFGVMGARETHALTQLLGS
jgi:type IV pilus assembly protein PilZ